MSEQANDALDDDYIETGIKNLQSYANSPFRRAVDGVLRLLDEPPAPEMPAVHHRIANPDRNRVTEILQSKIGIWVGSIFRLSTEEERLERIL